MENNLKKRVMRRVYLLYIKDVLVGNGFVVVSFLVVAILFFSISISDVLRNTPKESFGSVSSYLLSAFNNTELATKALLGLLAICAIVPLINSGLLSRERLPDLLPPSWLRGRSRAA